MDMSLVSAITAQKTAQVQAQVGTSVMKKAMDVSKDTASQLLSAMSGGGASASAMENSVTPWKGGNIDVLV